MSYTLADKPDGFYIQMVRRVEDDDSADLGDWLGAPPRYLLAVFAEARCMVVTNRVGTLLTITSPGLYGVAVNDRADPYVEKVYRAQRAELLATIARMQNPVVEEFTP